jgi:hypothetical protein
MLADTLLLRHCVVEALDGKPGVRIFAFDNEDGITGDITNYYDVAHPYRQSVYLFMLRAMRADKDRLTRENVDVDGQRLRDNVQKYTIKWGVRRA